MNKIEMELENKLLKEALNEIHKLACNPEQANPASSIDDRCVYAIGAIQYLSSQKRFIDEKEHQILLGNCQQIISKYKH